MFEENFFVLKQEYIISWFPFSSHSRKVFGVGKPNELPLVW